LCSERANAKKKGAAAEHLFGHSRNFIGIAH
jgi:hypothetical protein